MEEAFRRVMPVVRPGINAVPDPFSSGRRDRALDMMEADGLLEMLRQIQKILENDALDDFDCVEEILQLYQDAGQNVRYRHDFG